MSASADHQRMAEMVFGYWVSQAIRAYAELSLADHLGHGPLTAAEIAEREGAAPDATYRLTRAGLTLGLLTMDADKRFHATALLNTLRTRTPPRPLRSTSQANAPK